MTLKELYDKRSKVLADARSALDSVSAEGVSEERAAELERQHDDAMSEYDKLSADIARRERFEAASTREAELEEALRNHRRPHPGSPEQREETPQPREYRALFRDVLQHGIGSLPEEERSAFLDQAGQLSDAERRALETGQGSAGGYLIPQDMAATIDKALAMWGPMYDSDVCRVIETDSGNVITMPSIDDTSRRGSKHTESGATTDDDGADPTFGQKTLSAYIYKSEIVRIPYELLWDSAWNMEELMNDLFGESLGRTLNEVLTNGDGSSKPNGIVNVAGEKSVTSATAITGDDLIDLVHSVDPAYRTSPKCLFQLNDTTLGTVRKLKDQNDNYIWQEANIRSGEPAQLLGYGYRVNQALPNVEASAKPILFGDHGRYIVRKVRGGKVLRFDDSAYASKLQSGFMSFKRVDGEGMSSATAAIKALTMAAS